MKTRLAPLLLLSAWTPALAAPPTPQTPPAPPQTFGEVVEVNVVNVEVYVTDKAGKRVTDLHKGDFELLEDGKRIEISNFEAVAGRPSQAAAGPAGGPSDAPPGARAPEDAWNLVVYFDNQNIRPASRARAIRQLREFLTSQLSPGDRVMVVTNDFSLNVRLPFSSDPAAIAQALDGLGKLSAQGDTIARDRRQAFQAMFAIQEASLLDPDPLPCPQNIANPAHTYASARRQEVLRTINALTLLVNSLSGVPGRKAVLHVSDGIPLNPGEETFQFLVELCGGGGTSGFSQGTIAGATTDGGGGGAPKPGGAVGLNTYQVFDAREIGPAAYQAASQGPLDAQSYNVAKNLQSLAAHANAHRVTLYTLQPGLQASDASDASFGPEDRLFQFPSIGAALRASNRDSLQLLADETGGRAILDANEFLPDLARVHEDAQSFYSLGFTPAHSGDGREHKIEVKVKRPGLRLRYRQTYRDKTPLEKIVDRTFAALFYNIEDNPLDISVEIGEQSPGPSGSVAVPIRLRIPLFKLAILNRDETFQGSLKLFVITRSQDGATSPVKQVAVPLNIPRKELLRAMGQFYIYTLTLQLPPGEQRIALSVRDEIASTASFLSRAVTVSGSAAAH
jgi:VWFA-related protein